MVARKGLTALERRAEFAKAAALRDCSRSRAAEACGVSYSHLAACMDGQRSPSRDLADAVATYVKIPPARFWGPLLPEAGHPARLTRRRRAALRAGTIAPGGPHTESAA